MVFLSYSRQDCDRVDPLCEALIANGVDVWRDLNNIRGGAEWRDQIGEAIASADALVFCSSPTACLSGYVRKEVFFAKRREKPIVPINVSPNAVELPYALELEVGHLHFLNWPEDGPKKIAEAINAIARSREESGPDRAAVLSRELLESDSTRLRSLGNDYVTFHRLIDIDCEMAALRAGRIATRAVIYTAEALCPDKDPAGSGGFGSVFEKIEAEGVVSAEVCDCLRRVFRIAEKGSFPDSSSAIDFDAGPVVSTKEIKACEAALTVILRAIAESIRTRPQSARTLTSSLRVARGREIAEDQVEQMFYTGQRAFGADVMTSVAGMKRKFHRNPDIYQALVEESTGICIGYSSVMPLRREAFEHTIRPDFDEKMINLEDIEIMDAPGFYYLYLSSIVVDSAYRDLSLAYKVLYSGYLDYLAEMAERDIFVMGLSADAITDKGRRVCQSLGLRPVADRDGESTLFFGTLLPPKMMLSSRKGLELLRVYRETWEAFKEVLPPALPEKSPVPI